MEQKLYEGVYFTDFRSQQPGPPQCPPHITPQGVSASGEPGDTQFITFEELKQIKDTGKLSYLFASIMKRQTWLIDSTVFMLDDRDLWFDDDVAQAIDENVPLVDRYTQMLEWILKENRHAVEKGDEDKYGIAKEKADNLLKLYEEFKLERGVQL